MDVAELCEDPKRRFDSISSIIFNVNSGQQCDANALLDQLNSLPYHLDKFLIDEQTERVLCLCTQLAPYNEERLVVKLCQVIHNIVKKQRICLKSSALKILIDYLRPIVEKCDCWPHPYAMTALATLVYGNAAKIKEFWDGLFGPSGCVRAFASFGYRDRDVVRVAVKCFEGLTVKNAGENAYLEPEAATACYLVLLELATAPTPTGFDEALYAKVIFRSINGISNLVLHGQMAGRVNLGEILAVCKKYMLYGMGKGTYQPPRLHPGPVVEPAKTDDETTGVVPAEEYALSSETDYSDDEVVPLARAPETARLRLKQAQGRVRQCALQMLASIVKVGDRKLLSGYWTWFLPDSAGSTGTLITVILKDPVKRTRVAALCALSAILETSRHYWALADDRDEQTKPRAFTSLSLIVAHTVHEVLRGLLLALVSDGTFVATTHILKCLATLVSNVPVRKLKTGFLTRLTKATKDYLLYSENKDTNCEVAAMAVFEAVASADAADNEVLRLIAGEDRWRVGVGSSWLAELCVKKAAVGWKDGSGRNDTPLPLRLEALQVLAAITKNHFQIVRCHLVSVSGLISECLEDEESSVRLHGLRLLEVLGKAVAASVAKQSQAGPEIPTIEATWMWKNLLRNFLPRVFRDDKHPYLKAKAVDCVATVGREVYVLLPRSLQMHCVTLVVGLAEEDDGGVRAAAVRAAGFFVLFPSLRRDDVFMSDACDILLAAMKDGNADVKAKAAWSLGNFFDALVLNKEEGWRERVVGDERLAETARQAVVAANRCNERVKSNAVRALGNFLRFVRDEFFADPASKRIVDETVEVLVKTASCGGSVKVAWNSCYALGNLLRNGSPNVWTATWRAGVLRVLCNLVRDSKNFKVRINAAAALAVPACRRYFGESEEMAAVWKTLTEAVKTAREVAGFTEYNHKELLSEQLCCTMCHTISLMTPEDLALVAPDFPRQKDALRAFVSRHACRGGRAGDAIAATVQRVAAARSERPSDAEYHRCLDALSDCFAAP